MMHPYASRRRFRDHSWLENPIFWKYTNSVNGMSSLCQLQRYQKYLTTQSRFPAESISPTADHGPATSSPGTSINKSSSKSFQNWYSSTFLNFFCGGSGCWFLGFLLSPLGLLLSCGWSADKTLYEEADLSRWKLKMWVELRKLKLHFWHSWVSNPFLTLRVWYSWKIWVILIMGVEKSA